MKTQKKVSKQGRQGDVFLVRIDSIPKDAKERKPQGRIVIAAGTHTHAFPAKSVRLFDEAVQGRTITYVEVPKGGATLDHEEHDAIPFAEGSYVVVNQVESMAGVVAQVLD